MADVTRYVDGTLTGGANNGLAWGTAYEGVAGMQTCLTDATSAIVNAITAGDQVYIYLRNLFTVTATINVNVRSGNPAVNSVIHIIGCDAAGTELTKGNYVQFDASGTDLTDSPIFNIDEVKGYEFRNIHALNNIGSGTPAAHEDGFRVDNTDGALYIVVNFVNCKVTDCYRGVFIVHGNTFGVSITDFVATDLTNIGIECAGYAVVINGAYIEPAATVAGIDFTSGGHHIVLNSIINGGIRGIDFNSSYIVLADHCTIYNSSTECIYNDGANSMMNFTNNILMPAASATDYCVRISGGGMIGLIDHNLCWGIDAGAMGAGLGSQGTNEISQNPDFADVGSLDFRVRNLQVIGTARDGSTPGAVQPTFRGVVHRFRGRYRPGLLRYRK